MGKSSEYLSCLLDHDYRIVEIDTCVGWLLIVINKKMFEVKINSTVFASLNFETCLHKQKQEEFFQRLTGHYSLPNTSYYSENLFKMRMTYICYHGYVTIPICVFGIISNIFNVMVFRKIMIDRKKMMSFMNILLIGLAIGDLVGMVTYIPFVMFFYIIGDSGFGHCFSENWARFQLFNMHLTITCFVATSWLTIAIGIWRLIAVKLPLTAHVLCSNGRAKLTLAAISIWSIIIMLPLYLSFTVGELNFGNRIAYGVTYTELSKLQNHLLVRITFWMVGLFIRVGPCIILTVLSLSLIWLLHKAKAKRIIMLNLSEASANDRNSNMLLAILLFYLATELPSGILVLASGLLGQDFINNVVLNFNEITDMLTLINRSMNIIIYLSMSSKYRREVLFVFTSGCHQNSQST